MLSGKEDENKGILAVYSTHEITSEVYSYLESLAGLTSQVIINDETLTALDGSRKEALVLAEERELARREAVEMNEQLSTVRMAVSSSSDGIAVSNREGEFFYINRTLTTLFDFSITQLTKTPQELLFEDETIFRKVLNLTDRGTGWYEQVNMPTRRGKEIPVFMRVVPFKDKDDNIQGKRRSPAHR